MGEPGKRKIGDKFNSLFGELKKVTWPSFSKVVAQTGVVIAVTLFFLVVLMIMDFGLNELYKLLITGLDPDAVVKPLKTAFSTSITSTVQNFVPKL